MKKLVSTLAVLAVATALFCPPSARAGSDLFVQPEVFREVAGYYGYRPGTPIPNSLYVAAALKDYKGDAAMEAGEAFDPSPKNIDTRTTRYALPSGIEVTVDAKQAKLTISGIDRQQVGQVAAEMRSLRKPDPYKQKGVRYAGEKLKKKVGKTGAK